MKCNKGLHGALFKDHNGLWFCLTCGKEISHRSVRKLRFEANRKVIEIEALPPGREESILWGKENEKM